VHAAAAEPASVAKAKEGTRFSTCAFPDPPVMATEIVQYRRGETIYSQGDACDHVLYIQSGGVKLSVISKAGREGVVGMLGPGDFFGEAGLAGRPVRTAGASAITPSTILLIDTGTMVALLRDQHEMSDRFIAHVLSRNIRMEQDLIDLLFNSCEKRLARTLMLLAGDAGQAARERVVPKISQATLAEMIGTTRSRVNFFLNKFKKLGLIEYRRDRPLTIHDNLLRVVLDD
jgi:CRP/FNR family cyclic AMP-dependent transcriptional regulator